MPDSIQRNILIANRVAGIMALLAFTLLLILVFMFGFNINSPLIFGTGLFFLFIIYLNRKGSIDIGRFLLSVVPTLLTLAAALLAKLYEPDSSDILYYDARFFLVLLTIVPCLVFSTSEPFLLWGSILIIFLLLLMFDPIHELLGVGYFQRGFTGRSYYYINYVTAITFIGLASGVIILKLIIEKTEALNLAFKNDLIQKNIELSEVLTNVEKQNEEMVAQSEELYSSQEQLLQANNIIESQKIVLQQQMIQVNSNLEGANEELIRRNNELRQFSYTISHNLRGPIARLLGLAEVADLDKNLNRDTDAMKIINYIRVSAYELDHIIRDLSEIIDIRNNTNQVKQVVDFSQEWGEIRSLLHISDEMASENFEINFASKPFIFSVRPMINSILFNLISNAIKYESPDRKLKVMITTYHQEPFTVLEVKDNGLGIDLKLFQNDVFKMYKRFHMHKEGKGIGLYLVKSQAELLNGHVEIDSMPNSGATFKVYVRDPQAGSQIS
jgi:signal transduction histidine kinase